MCQSLLQTVTFQTVLVTDYANTYTEVSYEDGGMTWSIPTDTLQFYPVRIGTLAYTSADYSNKITNDYLHSSLLLFTASAVDILELERIDVYSENDIYGSNYPSTQPGRFFYELSINSPLPTFFHAGYLCYTWLEQEAIYATSYPVDLTDAHACPSNLNQLQQVSLQYTEYVSTSEYACYNKIVGQAGGTNQNLRHRCCYYLTSGCLIQDPRLVNGVNLYARFDSPQMELDDEAYSYCCASSYIASHMTDTAKCTQFKTFRPVSDFSAFASPTACKYQYILVKK